MSEGGAPFTKGELLAALERSRDLCSCRVIIRNRLLSRLARKGKEFLQSCSVAYGQITRFHPSVEISSRPGIVTV
jgi:hypothetical protein